jgi:hypothetical protein
MSPQSAPAAAPSARLRWFFSLAVVLHFAAILAGVTGPSDGPVESPYLCVRASDQVAPYLQILGLQSSYRFYAPNPGCDPAIWFRVRYSDGSVRWVELPPSQSHWERLLHHRGLSLAKAATETMPWYEGNQEKQEKLVPMAQLCLASYLRHVARSHPKARADGTPLSIQGLRVYSVQHRPMTPAEARDRWDFDDLRLHWAYSLGQYSAEGTRQDGKDQVVPVDMAELTAWMIRADLAPALAQDAKRLTAQLAEVGLPRPIANLVRQHPQLVEAADDELTQRVQEAIEGHARGNLAATNP